ncbi:hypothetical protein F5Y06DRAFT_304058 [Hypoxylon sp. FL0890]|nr:hypothetical protein F5Y06DRAFT_304058 [Hypoxylon sp. FL0890]
MSRSPVSTRPRSQDQSARNQMERQLERSPSPIPQQTGNSARESNASREFTNSGSSSAAEQQARGPEESQDQSTSRPHARSSSFLQRHRLISDQYATPASTLRSIVRDFGPDRRGHRSDTASNASSENQPLISSGSDKENDQLDPPGSPVSATAVPESSHGDTERSPEPGSPASVITVIRNATPAESSSPRAPDESDEVNELGAFSTPNPASVDRQTSDNIDLANSVVNDAGHNTLSVSNSRTAEAVAAASPSLSESRSLSNTTLLNNISSIPNETRAAIQNVYTVLAENYYGTDGTLPVSMPSNTAELQSHAQTSDSVGTQNNAAASSHSAGPSSPTASQDAPPIPVSGSAAGIVASAGSDVYPQPGIPLPIRTRSPVHATSPSRGTPGGHRRIYSVYEEDSALAAEAGNPTRYTSFGILHGYENQRAHSPSPPYDADRSPPRYSESFLHSSRPPTRRERALDHAIGRGSSSRRVLGQWPRDSELTRQLQRPGPHSHNPEGSNPAPSTYSNYVDAQRRNQQPGQEERGERDGQAAGLGTNRQQGTTEQGRTTGQQQEQQRDADARTLVDVEQQAPQPTPPTTKERLKRALEYAICLRLPKRERIVCLTCCGLSIVLLIFFATSNLLYSPH